MGICSEHAAALQQSFALETKKCAPKGSWVDLGKWALGSAAEAVQKDLGHVLVGRKEGLSPTLTSVTGNSRADSTSFT